MSEKERLITAYHEMGHALVGHFLEHADPVHKISVISRGQALGYTISMPQEGSLPDHPRRAGGHDGDDARRPRRGGNRLRRDTTGASNDIEKVTATAKQMVMRFGMSQKLGPGSSDTTTASPSSDREFSSEPDYSDEIAREIDDEIRRIIESGAPARHLDLTEHEHDSRTSPRSSSNARRSRRRSRGAAGWQERGGSVRHRRHATPELPAPPAPPTAQSAKHNAAPCRAQVSPAAPPRSARRQSARAGLTSDCSHPAASSLASVG